MAYFKQVREIYETEESLRNLIMYAANKSVYTEAFNLYPLGMESYIEQMIYYQRCRAKNLTTRALHFVLSFDTANWEWEMETKQVMECIYILKRTMDFKGIGDYQTLYFVHDNVKNRHVHIVMNPINLKTGNVFQWSKSEYYDFSKELSINLFDRYGVALIGTSFVTGDGRLCFNKYPSFLYENRDYPWETHMRKSLS